MKLPSSIVSLVLLERCFIVLLETQAGLTRKVWKGDDSSGPGVSKARNKILKEINREITTGGIIFILNFPHNFLHSYKVSSFSRIITFNFIIFVLFCFQKSFINLPAIIFEFSYKRRTTVKLSST